MTQTQKPYHHGDLRAALMAAAEAELSERGIEAFSMRQVAKRAGVSSAAPAHHFGDVNGVLTALAAEGFRRFIAAQNLRQQAAPPEARAQLVALGLGYVDFAIANPALFRLMFGSGRTALENAELNSVSRVAFFKLVDAVGAVSPEATAVDIAAAWAAAHGLADLLMAGRLKTLHGMPPKARDAAIAEIVGRSVR